MMKNNQMFQRLELSTLASMINNTSSKSKDDVSQQSGSLYDAQDSEGFEQEEVSKVHILLCITMFVLLSLHLLVYQFLLLILCYFANLGFPGC